MTGATGRKSNEKWTFQNSPLHKVLCLCRGTTRSSIDPIFPPLPGNDGGVSSEKADIDILGIFWHPAKSDGCNECDGDDDDDDDDDVDGGVSGPL